ncbi:MAG TPA: S8 family serine peptidase, partial [Anaerolineaceae bacterium]|nr:S8 family serine peptidase [Anaerolineaceae bacterium]
VVGTPAVFVGHSAGVALQARDGQAIDILIDELTTATVGGDDALAGFSSRGPRGFDSVLKPEVAAPGTNIFAAAMGSGAGGTTMEGTSMATPHVTGAVALIRQLHPDWTPEQVKAALMNTAVQVAAEVPQVGAGLINAVKAIETTSFAVADPKLVSLNWGLIEFNTAQHSLAKTVTVTNEDTAAKTYSLSWAWGSGSNDYGANLTLPESITVQPGSTATFDVGVDLGAQQIHAVVGGWPDTTPYYLGEYFGLIQLQNTDELKSDDVLTLPFYFLPQPYSMLTASSLTVNPTTDIATGSIDHHGPVRSALEVWPVYATDPEESAIRDNADLRMVMMDWFADGADYVGFGFNLYGALHNPQRYITEIDLYLDVDQDSVYDYVVFNFNEGYLLGGDHDNLWSLVMIDLETELAYWGSDYYIWTDFNSGTMFWNLPASWYDLGPGASQFDFEIESYDLDGDIDLIPAISADYRQVPFYSELGIRNPLGSKNVPIELSFTSPAVYEDGLIEGAALFDYSGKAGPGQVTLLNLEIGDPGSQVFLPLVVR